MICKSGVTKGLRAVAKPVGRGQQLTELATSPRHTSVVAAAEMLLHVGDVREALRLARRELLKACRARSRKRFAFWTEVATEMENLRADQT